MYDRFAMNNTLSQLLREIIKIEDIPDIPISGISINSSDITPGELYIAIKGSNYDGHEFIPEAIKNGATSVLLKKNDDSIKSIPCLYVKNPRKAMSNISAQFYGNPSKKMNVICITGTNGKTSITQILYQILQKTT